MQGKSDSRERGRGNIHLPVVSCRLDSEKMVTIVKIKYGA
jgi:hypothetical protein